MIRPLTIATFLLACGSGLYLYQSKHEVQVLDRTIERTVHETSALREQSRLLAAEWTMLNDPERLRQFSDSYLPVRSIAPTQFTSMADLNNRLPATQAAVPAVAMDEDEAAVRSTPVPVPEPAAAAVVEEVLPIPPIPALPPTPMVASVSRPPDAKVLAPRPVMAESQPRQAVPEARPAVVAEARAPEPRRPVVAPQVAEAHPVAPQPRPVVVASVPRPQVPVSLPYNPPAQAQQVMAAAPPPYGGSLLGMARGSMPPTPRPTPVSATYNAN